MHDSGLLQYLGVGLAVYRMLSPFTTNTHLPAGSSLHATNAATETAGTMSNRLASQSTHTHTHTHALALTHTHTHTHAHLSLIHI